MRKTIERFLELQSVPVKIDHVEAELTLYQVEKYEDPEGRPSTLIRLESDGIIGSGEFIGWTIEAHDQFLQNIQTLKGASGTLEELGSRFGKYARPAVECALIDLVLKKRSLSIFDYLEISPKPMSYLISLDASLDIPHRVEQIQRSNINAGFKIDVHLGWTPEIISALRELNCIRILDFKGIKDQKLAQKLREFFPDSIFEDSPIDKGLISDDDNIRAPEDIYESSADMFNIKIGRMSGVFSAIKAIQILEQQGKPFYFGGQFEMSVAREQSQKLASIFCPEATNDLAPIVMKEEANRGENPLLIENVIGF